MHDNGSRQFEGGELEVPLSETQELELASELLEVTSEQELEQFLGDVFHGVGNALGQFVRSDTGQALGSVLKDAAAKALPVVGRAIGERIAPGRGGDLGGQLAQAAGGMLGLELEGLSPQDQEFESARQFVRLAGAATHQALLAPPSWSPDETARRAAAAAAERFAPGLVHEVGRGWRQPTRPEYGGPGRRGYGGRGGPTRRYPASGQYRRPASYGRRAPYGGRAQSRGAASYRRSGGARYGARYGPPTGRPPGQWRPGGWHGQGGRAPGHVRAGVPAAGYRAGWQRPFQPYRYGAAQRSWQQRWQRPGQPQAWQRPWQQQGWQRPWQPGYRQYQYGGQTSDDGGGFYDAQSWGQAYPGAGGPQPQIGGSTDWSRPLHFFGPTPPPAPTGAPGRWVYGGLRRGHRLWRWVPFPQAAQFWWPAPDSYGPVSAGDVPSEPEPSPPGPGPMPSPGPQPTFEPAPPPAAPGAPPNGAPQPDAGGQPMSPSDQSPQNGTAPAAPQGT